MGICSSRDLNSSSGATAKLILGNGLLEEFLYPIKASQILKRNPSCFICRADAMNYDEYIPAIDGDEELQLGHLYLALPLNWLSTRLKPHQMATLAVKTSLALKTVSSGSGRRSKWREIRKVDPWDYTASTKAMERSRMVLGGDLSDRSAGVGRKLVVKRKGRRSGDRRRGEFSPNLSDIMEE